MSEPKLTMLKGSKKKQFSGSNRRRWARLPPSDIPTLRSVTLNQGSEVKVIDISAGGMLLESEQRLRPQMKILLKLVTSEGVFRVSGSVLRSSISSLKGVLRFQSAIAFEHPLQMLDPPKDEPMEESDSSAKAEVPATFQESMLPMLQTDEGSELSDSPTILTISASDMPGMPLHKVYRLNNW
jgi:hypothetical protein